MTCKQCRDKTKCEEDAFIHGATFDPYSSAKYCTGFEPITNADRIRAMSDEELEKIIAIIARFDTCINPGRDCEECPLLSLCENCLPMHELEWLQQPAEEG